MKQLVALVMIAFLVPATATVAFAKNACKDEKAKFCKDAKTAGKKVNDCLKEHIAEVSPACKEQLEKPKEPKTDKEEGRQEDKERTRTRKPARSPPRRSPQSQPPFFRDPALGACIAWCSREQVTTLRAVPSLWRHGQYSSFRLRA